MRLDLHAADAAYSPAPPMRAARRARPDAVEWAALAVFAALSLWTLGLDLGQVIAHGRVWTGTDGTYITDQMQYLAWIKDASHHVLVSNLFVLRSTPADYFQPAVVISGALTALGMAPWLALLLWKPVAVVSLWLAFRAYVHRTVPGRLGRRAALILALFFGSYTLVYGQWGVVGDMMPGFLSWGYTFGLLALALMVFALVRYERARERGEITVVPGVLGAIAALLHPWHGELFVVVLVGAEAALWWLAKPRRRPPLGLAVLTVGLTGAALLYYEILGRADKSWELARVASKHGGFPLWTVALAAAPLLVPAALAWRAPQRTFGQIATRVWPVATLIIWVLSASALSATPLHAVQGLTLPLGVLAVQGVARLRLDRAPRMRLAAVPAIALLTVPGTIKLMQEGKQLASPTYNNANFIAKPERAALRYLAHTPDRGGVLARPYLGLVVPALTDRNTFVGDCLWSEPGCSQRVNATQALFSGSMAPGQARAFVRATGARFLLSDCKQAAELSHVLGSMLLSVHRFGCATVYELADPAKPTGPLAESGRYAAVRPSWRQ